MPFHADPKELLPLFASEQRLIIDVASKQTDIVEVDHLLEDGRVARQYAIGPLKMEQFSASLHFKAYANGWCTAGLSKGYGYQILDDNNTILTQLKPKRFEMPIPRKWYSENIDIEIDQAIFDRAAVFKFIAAADTVVPC